jgi:hypothetical protein
MYPTAGTGLDRLIEAVDTTLYRSNRDQSKPRRDLHRDRPRMTPIRECSTSDSPCCRSWRARVQRTRVTRDGHQEVVQLHELPPELDQQEQTCHPDSYR